MTEILILFIILILVTILLLMVGFYAWKRYWLERNIPPAKTTFFLLLICAIWVFAFAMQLISDTPSIYHFWTKIAYIGAALAGPTWLILILQWTGRDQWITKRKIILFYLIPMFCLILMFTDSFHNLIWTDLQYTSYETTLRAIPEYGPFWWLLTIYSYITIMTGVILLGKSLFNLRKIYRKHVTILMGGTLTPLIVNIVYNIKPSWFLYTDITAVSFLITGLAYAWGFSKLKLIDVVPVARNAIFENMKDPVFVLDNRNRIIDATPQALKTFNKKPSEVIGRKINQVFSDYNKIIKNIKGRKEGRMELPLKKDGEQHYYDMQINPILDHHRNFNGRVFSLRDITERKNMEIEIQNKAETLKKMNKKLNFTNKELKKTQKKLRSLNEKLEDKVKERTARIEELLKLKDEFISHLGHDLRTPLTPYTKLITNSDKKRRKS